MRSVILMLVFFISCSVSVAHTQSAAMVHFNQPFYVAGEVIFYNLYLPDNFPAGPKVITVSLLDNNGDLVEQSYLRRSQSEAISSFYRIPFSWRSGRYRLVFHVTQEDTHEPRVLAEAFLPIYDDLAEKEVRVEGPVPVVTEKSKFSDLQIDVQADRSHYRPGETANIQIVISDQNGNPVEASVSVSVRDQQLFKQEDLTFSTLQIGKILQDTSQLEEDITLRGRLLDPDAETPLASGSVVAYLQREYQFLYAKANQDGYFTLDLPTIYGDIPIHMINYLLEDIRVELEQVPALNSEEKDALPYPGAIKTYLEQSRKRKLIYQLYGRLEQELPLVFPETGSNPKPTADNPVALDEYEAFPDLMTMVRDLSIPIRFRKWENDRPGARIFDSSQSLRSYYVQRPLFIVDGMLTRDDNFIANLDISKLEYFDLFYAFDRLMELYGPVGRYGLVRIDSRNRDVKLPEADQQNFFQLKGFPAEVSYPITTQSAEQSPVNLHPSLYWEPEARTDASGKLQLSVPLSDDQSTFLIEVMVQDSQHRRGQGNTTFTVELNGK